MINRLSLILIIIVLLLPSPARAQGDDKQWLMAQINSFRGQLGLHAYVWNEQLAAAAQQQSEYMASTGHVSHTQSNGSTPASRAAANGYTGRFVSENIYGGGIAVAADAWNFWINSPAHYHGIAHTRNNEIGVGVATSDRGTYFTLVFGYQSNLSAPPAVAPPTNPEPNNEAPDTGQSAPPVRVVPPTNTFTPSATVPTLTPTITWTPTATWTPSPTVTIPPATSTPIYLSTSAIIAAMASSTHDAATPTPQPPASNQVQNHAQPDSTTGDLPLWFWIVGAIAVIAIGLIFIVYGMTRLNGAVNAR